MTHEMAITDSPTADTLLSVVSVADLDAVWKDRDAGIDWRCLFTLPPWLSAWQTAFGGRQDLRICLIRRGQVPIGAVPLKLRGRNAGLIGSADVCDYLDVAAVPGRETMVGKRLVGYLAEHGIRQLEVTGVRPDATIGIALETAARQFDGRIDIEPEAVSYEIDLPDSWDAYLYRLNGKQRHEIRRKMRRIEDAGRVRFRMVPLDGDIDEDVSRFIELFRGSRPDKAAFMTDAMAGFFRHLSTAMQREGLLRIGTLTLDGRTVATVMCFDYRSTRYLYNSGFDLQFRSLSVGLLSKVFSIQDAIERGLTTYDFLKGGEGYKQRLGGRAVDIRRYRLTIAE